jgi:hypothetical protein
MRVGNEKAAACRSLDSLGNNNIMACMLHQEEQELEAVNRGTAFLITDGSSAQ